MRRGYRRGHDKLGDFFEESQLEPEQHRSKGSVSFLTGALQSGRPGSPVLTGAL